MRRLLGEPDPVSVRVGQAFNSLHAQREACEAYVLSQAGEGWTLVKAAYDDGGFSGGNIDRPALKRLLADIANRMVDVVVVYKVDRLTRSLADFAKIVEIFDASDASFVSITQPRAHATHRRLPSLDGHLMSRAASTRPSLRRRRPLATAPARLRQTSATAAKPGASATGLIARPTPRPPRRAPAGAGGGRHGPPTKRSSPGARRNPHSRAPLHRRLAG